MGTFDPRAEAAKLDELAYRVIKDDQDGLSLKRTDDMNQLVAEGLSIWSGPKQQADSKALAIGKALQELQHGTPVGAGRNTDITVESARVDDGTGPRDQVESFNFYRHSDIQPADKSSGVTVKLEVGSTAVAAEIYHVSDSDKTPAFVDDYQRPLPEASYR